MSNLSRTFARLINPGVILTQELSMQIFHYESLLREQSELDVEIRRIRKKQDKIEDGLAEALAEDEFQRCLSGHPNPMPTEEQQLDIFKQHLGRVIGKLADKYERKIYLDVDMRKLKKTIEKAIVAANDLNAEAEAD